MRSKTTTAAFALLLAAPIGLPGCGSDDDYKNTARPPAPINVTVAITKRSVEVSPESFGAGPVVLIIANQTAQSRKVTLETSDTSSSAGTRRRSTDPIDPAGTGQIKANVEQGTYSLSAGGGSVRAARIKVSKSRPSAQNDLLQP